MGQSRYETIIPIELIMRREPKDHSPRLSAWIDAISLSTENPCEIVKYRAAPFSRRLSQDRIDQSLIDLVQSSQIKNACWETYHPKATPVLTDHNVSETRSPHSRVNPASYFFQSTQLIHFPVEGEHERSLILENQIPIVPFKTTYKSGLGSRCQLIAIYWYSSREILPSFHVVRGSRALEKGTSKSSLKKF